MEIGVYLKVSKNDDWFITSIEGLNIDELLNLTEQSMKSGFNIESSTAKEQEEIKNMPLLAQKRMEKLFREWDQEIEWNQVF